MNTFDLQCNDGTWELTNISSVEAKNVRFQLHLIVPDGDRGTTRPTDIRIEEIESLMPKQRAALRFDDQFTAVAMSRMQVDINGLHQYKEGDRGYSLQVFFEHSAEAYQIIYLWATRSKKELAEQTPFRMLSGCLSFVAEADLMHSRWTSRSSERSPTQRP